MSKNIYNKDVPKCCGHCANAQISMSLKLVFCKFRGPVSEDDVCRKYIYDPVKRVPKSSAKLPQYSKEDFML